MRKKQFLFAALIPHRDCIPPLEAVKRELFGRGFYGAFSFPLAIPLALISRELDAGELKKLALALREKTLTLNGKMIAERWAEIAFAGLRFGGQKLNIPPLPTEDFPPFTIEEACPFPLLAVYISDEKTPIPAFDPAPISFRAAYVSNLSLTPLSDDGYSFSWSVSGQVWLPRFSPPKTL